MEVAQGHPKGFVSTSSRETQEPEDVRFGAHSCPRKLAHLAHPLPGSKSTLQPCVYPFRSLVHPILTHIPCFRKGVMEWPSTCSYS